MLPTCWQQFVVMEFGKRHDTTDTMEFCPCQLVTDLLRGNLVSWILATEHDSVIRKYIQ